MATSTKKKALPQLTLFAETPAKRSSSVKAKKSKQTKEIKKGESLKSKQTSLTVPVKKLSQKKSLAKVIVKSTKAKKKNVSAKKTSIKKFALKKVSKKSSLQKKNVLKKNTKVKAKKRGRVPVRTPIEMRVWVEVLNEKDMVMEKDYFVQLQERQHAMDIMQQLRQIVKKPGKRS